MQSQNAKMEERIAQEKEKRVEHTKDIAIRRISKRELSRGWVAWKEAYLEQARTLRALKAAGNKLLRPKFVACFAQLRRDWEASKLTKATMSMEKGQAEEMTSTPYRNVFVPCSRSSKTRGMR